MPFIQDPFSTGLINVAKDSPIRFPLFGDGFVINPPSSIRIFGMEFFIYGILIAVGFILAVLYCFNRSKKFGVKTDNLLDMLFFSVPLAIICARLYYCAFEWDYYSRFPAEIINVRSGGLAIYGGIIGAVAGAVIYCRIKKIPITAMLDAGCSGLLIGQAVGRWGNFTNRECFGTQTKIFCRMGLTDSVTGKIIYVHPTFLYESLWNILGLALLHIFTKKAKRKFDGQLFVMYAGWYGLGRVMIEGLRTDSLYIGSTTIRVSQALAALSLVAAVILLIYFIRKPPVKPLWVDSEKNPMNTREDTIEDTIEEIAEENIIAEDTIEEIAEENIIEATTEAKAEEIQSSIEEEK